jgi:phosphate transport system substrate-binding protein
VVLTYNLEGLTAPLRLSGEVVADLFLGKITTWNDARIAALNPGLKLPTTAVMIAHRADGSGTTAVFSDYLSKVSPEWKSKVGSNTALNWPVGLGGKGTEGVTGLVKQTPGAVGYVELSYAAANNLSFATLQNTAGNFVAPSPRSVTAAAASSVNSMPKDFRVSITNAAGKDSYPISSAI